jgi:hypothetical protein
MKTIRKLCGGLVIILLLETALVSRAVQAKNDGSKNIVPPSEKGPYNVGITTFCAVMNGGRITRVSVFYPTLDAQNCNVTFPVYRLPQAGPPAGIASLDTCFNDEILTTPTRYCAVKDAAPAPGKFSMVLYDHGGGAAGPDGVRFNQKPLLETMASHGIISVTAPHSGVLSNWIPDLKLLVTMMLKPDATAHTANAILENQLSARIDSKRIGISGTSAGGVAALITAGGIANGNPPVLRDTRLRAIMVSEPGFPSFDADKLDIPLLLMGGDQYSAGLALPGLFDAVVNAVPRIYVLTPRSLHFSYSVGMCDTVNAAREYALENDPTLRDPDTDELIIEPLTHWDPATRLCKPGPSQAARNACGIWNMGRLSLPPICNLADPATFNFGGARNFCDKTGVDSIESLDLDSNGLTDALDPVTGTTLFNISDECTMISPPGESPVTGEEMVLLVTHYSVAFWKKFLDGDGRYMRYLTPGYANVHGLEVEVDIRD